MEEFIKREGNKDGQFTIPEDQREKLANVATGCDKRAKSRCILSFFLDQLN